MKMTIQVAKVLRAFLEHPGHLRYGLDLMEDTGLRSGVIYPILGRLENERWLESQVEDIDPSVLGRPVRRYYHLTPQGVEWARLELAALAAVANLAQSPREARRAVHTRRPEAGRA